MFSVNARSPGQDCFQDSCPGDLALTENTWILFRIDERVDKIRYRESSIHSTKENMLHADIFQWTPNRLHECIPHHSFHFATPVLKQLQARHWLSFQLGLVDSCSSHLACSWTQTGGNTVEKSQYIDTDKTSQDITPFHFVDCSNFFGYCNFLNFYH